MRKFIFTALAAVLGLSLVSCQKETKEPEMVSVSFDYDFASGSMTKATAGEVYSTFYENQIKTRKSTPSSYTLTLTDPSTSNKVAVFNGIWGKGDAVQIPVGKYHVTGTSTGSTYAAYIKFDEDITISASSSTITLNAIYDCALILIDKGTRSLVYFYPTTSGGSSTLSSTDDVFYLFYQQTSTTNGAHLRLYKDSAYTYVYLDNFEFKNGYYYYMNDLTESFNIPQMENGQE